MRYLTGIALAALLLAGSAQAEMTPSKGHLDPRVRDAVYEEAQVFRLHGFVGYQIDLQFEPGETFLGLGAGDMDGLSFVGQENHLFIKPKAAKVTTNLTVLTNRRHYHFDYSATSQKPIDDDAIYSLRFTYPDAAVKKAAEIDARRLGEQLGSAASRRPRNIDYWYCGDPSLRPSAASDDGVHTRLTFAANADLPAIFVGNADNSESLLNFSVDAGDVVIHRVAQRFILRRGKLTGCVVNRGYVGAGQRLESGTIDPSVERTVQGTVP